MSPAVTALFGFIICGGEAFFTILILLLVVNEYWHHHYGGLVIYSIIILLANALPLVITGNPLFAWSTGLAAASIIMYFICYLSGGFDDHPTNIIASSSLGLGMICLVVVMFVAVATSDYNQKDLQIDSQAYETRYKIVSNGDRSGVYLVTSGENETSYYVIMYEDFNESGESTIKVLQISPLKIDIVFATEEQEDDFLIEYRIDHIYNGEKDTDKNKLESTYSYKLCIRHSFPIVDIVPKLN